MAKSVITIKMFTALDIYNYQDKCHIIAFKFKG